LHLRFFPLLGLLFAYYSLRNLEMGSIKIKNTFAESCKEVNMKKAACAVLIFIMIIFLVNPLPSEARGGHWGWWWAPWAVIGGAAVLAPYYAPAPYYYAPYYYPPYYAPAPVVVREQPQVYVQPAPSVQPSSSERIFVYGRQDQSEELQAKDRYECHRWAVSQTHFDPSQPAVGVSLAQLNQMRGDYQRAMGACLDGRGYTTK
jgi:hypothetical protein